MFVELLTSNASAITSSIAALHHIFPPSLEASGGQPSVARAGQLSHSCSSVLQALQEEVISTCKEVPHNLLKVEMIWYSAAQHAKGTGRGGSVNQTNIGARLL